MSVFYPICAAAYLQAFATDAADQSPWMYYRWLLGNSLAHVMPPSSKGGTPSPDASACASATAGAPSTDAGGEAGSCSQRGGGAAPLVQPDGSLLGDRDAGGSTSGHEGSVGEERGAEARAVLRDVLAREVARFECDHLSSDPDAKWPLLMLARLKEAQARLGLLPTGAQGAGGAGEGGAREGLLGEARAIYARLALLDPLRRGYYEDAAAGKAFVVVQALGTV